MTSRWLAVRVEFISNTVVFTTALMVSAVLPVNAGFAGLAITAAVNLTDNLSVFVRMVSLAMLAAFAATESTLSNSSVNLTDSLSVFVRIVSHEMPTLLLKVR